MVHAANVYIKLSCKHSAACALLAKSQNMRFQAGPRAPASIMFIGVIRIPFFDNLSECK
jgi:hypothetical protein